MPDPEDCAGQPAHDPELLAEKVWSCPKSYCADEAPQAEVKRNDDDPWRKNLNARSWLFAPGDSERKNGEGHRRCPLTSSS